LFEFSGSYPVAPTSTASSSLFLGGTAGCGREDEFNGSGVSVGAESTMSTD
jgi:hypothetical protein